MAKVKIVKREACETNINVSQPLPNTSGINGYDTDRDTCCLGKNFIISVWDNPFDLERPFSIQVNDEVEIPLDSKGTKIFFKSRVPTKQEMQYCPKVDITSPAPLNPSSVKIQNIQTSKCDKHKWNQYSVNEHHNYCENISVNGMTLSEMTSIPMLNESNLLENYNYDLEDVPHLRTIMYPMKDTKSCS